MLEKILVATDASPATNRAIALASDMAAKYDATLYLLHVVRDMQLPPELKRMAEVEKVKGERDDVLKFVGSQILANGEALAKKKGVKKVRTSLGKGDPASAILAYAKRNEADLVVLGTRGLGKVKGMLMGSVSRKVADMGDVSCLIVR